MLPKIIFLSLVVMLGITSTLRSSMACQKQQPVWQNGPAVALLNGQYDGVSTVKQVRRHGNQGVGIWDKLDGEGLIVDGVFYKAHIDGRVEVMPDDATLPWTTVSFFNPDMQFELPSNVSMAALQSYVEAKLPTLNTYFAFRISGEFTAIQARSYAKQEKPYPPLCKIKQSTFSFNHEKGILIGFRSPEFSAYMSAPKWHFHFLNADKTKGGHVLSFTLASGSMKIDKTDNVHIAIPDNPVYNGADLRSRVTCN